MVWGKAWAASSWSLSINSSIASSSCIGFALWESAASYLRSAKLSPFATLLEYVTISYPLASTSSGKAASYIAAPVISDSVCAYDDSVLASAFINSFYSDCFKWLLRWIDNTLSSISPINNSCINKVYL